MNMNQFTQKTIQAIQDAQRLAVEYQNNAIEQEHLLAALCAQQDGLIPQLLTKNGRRAGQLPCRRDRKGRRAAPCDRQRPRP